MKTFLMILAACLMIGAGCATETKAEAEKHKVEFADYSPEIILTQGGADDGGKWGFSEILNAVLTTVSLLFGGFLLKAKNKVRQLIHLAGEIYDFGDKVMDAIEDNTLTVTEKKSLKKEWQDVKSAAKAFITLKKRE